MFMSVKGGGPQRVDNHQVCRYLREKARPHGGRTPATDGLVVYSSESQSVVDEEG